MAQSTADGTPPTPSSSLATTERITGQRQGSRSFAPAACAGTSIRQWPGWGSRSWRCSESGTFSVVVTLKFGVLAGFEIRQCELAVVTVAVAISILVTKFIREPCSPHGRPTMH